MIPTLPRPAWLRTARRCTSRAFLVFLFLPLATVAVFAFNNAPYPAPPWHGFTLDWFFGNEAAGRVGLFHDPDCWRSVWTSVVVACWVTLLSVTVGTANAFLMERAQFPGKGALSLLMLTPLVIPGVILGISILAFASRIADFAGDIVRPGAGLPASRPAAGGARPVLVHRRHRHADDQRAPQALRPHARGGGAQPRRLAPGGAVDHHPALSARRR